jgi:hypothetical protein
MKPAWLYGIITDMVIADMVIADMCTGMKPARLYLSANPSTASQKTQHHLHDGGRLGAVFFL